jgi:hypothetical protein
VQTQTAFSDARKRSRFVGLGSTPLLTQSALGASGEEGPASGGDRRIYLLVLPGLNISEAEDLTVLTWSKRDFARKQCCQSR